MNLYVGFIFLGMTSGVRNKSVAAELRAEMARQRISGRNLAKRVGLPSNTLARWLRGEHEMSIDEIEMLAEGLAVTTVDLVARAYENKPPPNESMESRPTNPCLSGVSVIMGPWVRPPGRVTVSHAA